MKFLLPSCLAVWGGGGALDIDKMKGSSPFFPFTVKQLVDVSSDAEEIALKTV